MVKASHLSDKCPEIKKIYFCVKYINFYPNSKGLSYFYNFCLLYSLNTYLILVS